MIKINFFRDVCLFIVKTNYLCYNLSIEKGGLIDKESVGG